MVFHACVGNKYLLKNPEVFFQVLYQCQALKVLWPELHNLWGIPNPEKWHPEVCSGVHTMMVLKQAVILFFRFMVSTRSFVFEQ